MTDCVGILEHSLIATLDSREGYCVDDNARALVVATLHYKKFRTPFSLKLASIYLNFLCRVTKPDGYFNNYVNPNHVVDEQRTRQENLRGASAR